MKKAYIAFTQQEIRNALVDYYGIFDEISNPNGIGIHYLTTTSLIFSIPNLSNKVYRLYTTSKNMQYGDSWTSGDAIINPIDFAGISFMSGATSGFLICSDDFILFNSYPNSRIWVIGKLTNGESICFGAYYVASSNYAVNCIGFNFSIDENILPVTSAGVLLSAQGEIYKNKVYFQNMIGRALTNTDGSLAYINGLDIAFYKAGSNPIKNSNYFLTSSGLYMLNSTNYYPNSFLVPNLII